MKVILKQNVKKLGEKGSVINVSDGYARNFLFPRSLAEAYTPSSKKSLEQEKKVKQEKIDRLLKHAKQEAETLTKKPIIIKAKSGEKGKLFGSVTSQDISKAIKNQRNIEISKKDIVINDHIKNLGTFTVKAKIHSKVTANIKIEVVEE